MHFARAHRFHEVSGDRSTAVVRNVLILFLNEFVALGVLLHLVLHTHGFAQSIFFTDHRRVLDNNGYADNEHKYD